jgi:DNA-binding winged helix-turn-helix (wHTH) protein/Tol biopolymer transport system component
LPVSAARKLRFEAFELDRQTAELWKGGYKLKLQGQPIAVLSLLLERPGELVTREELRQYLWPGDTFVDFEHSLNTHIKKLRQVLNDNPDAPRFIETLPRRGYRFIAPVEIVSNGSTSQAASKTDFSSAQNVVSGANALSVEPMAMPEKAAPARLALEPVPARPRNRWRAVGAIAVVVVGSALSWLWLHRPQTPVVTGIHQLTQSGRPKSLMGSHRVVTDGTRVYFDEVTGSGWHIAQVSVKGGDVTYIDTPLIANPRIADISQDGSELLVISDDGEKHDDVGKKRAAFWIVQLPSGEAQRLPDMAAQYTWMQFLPGGSQVAYVKGNSLFAAERDGTRAHKLIDLPSAYSVYAGGQYAFSPDAKTVRFAARPWEIWQGDLATGESRRFLPRFPDAIYGSGWSHDGELYLFDQLVYEQSSIWAVAERGYPWRAADSHPVRLTNGPISFPWATVARDNKQIYAIGESKRGELSTYDAKTGEFRPYLNGASIGFVDYSPDGQWITYVGYPDGTLWRSRADGSQRQQLTTPAMGVILSPKWSPDGRLILFNAWQVDSRKEDFKQIYVIPAEGGSPLLLVSGKFEPADPTWSPDGKSIAYGGAGGSGDATEVRILDLNTKESKSVPGSKGMFAPRWSPDGRYLATQSSNSQKAFLYSFQSQTWSELHISPDSAPVGWHTWSHDGRDLYVMTSTHKVFRYRVADGRAVEVADAKDTGILCPVFRWGWWFQLTPDDRVVMLLDRGTDELYSLDLEYH